MLTDSAMYKRRWGQFPTLGKVLEPARAEFEKRVYPTSVSDTEFDYIRRLLSVAALVAASRGTLVDFILAESEVNETASAGRHGRRPISARRISSGCGEQVGGTAPRRR